MSRPEQTAAHTPPASSEYRYAAYGRPCRGERKSGDVAVMDSTEESLLLAMVDVLGHGAEANAVAQRAEAALRSLWTPNVMDTMSMLHKELSGSRGAAAGVAVIERASGALTYCGVGNTEFALLGVPVCRLPSTPGIVGGTLRTPSEQRLKLDARAIVLLYTDGLSSGFERDIPRSNYLFPVMDLARNLVRTYGKVYDDVTCLVARRGSS